MESKTTYRVTDVQPISGELIEFEEQDSHIRYSADNWVWRIGESTETVFDCTELEGAYQLWKSRQ